MNSKQYDMWIKRHQVKDHDINIANAVMSRIAEKTQKPSVVKQTCETVLLNLVQAKGLVRACVLVSGAVMGILRVVFQLYSMLFT